MTEIWKDIPGYDGLYQISNFGRVKSLDRVTKRSDGKVKSFRERILKPGTNKQGYLTVALSKYGKPKTKQVHQLVAIAFLNHKPNGHTLVVNHINFNKTDNRLENLEIVTTRENSNKKHLNSKSKYTGVYWHKPSKKWYTQITINGKLKHLGFYNNEHIAGVRFQLELAKIKQNQS
jgi:hypothetical protein